MIEFAYHASTLFFLGSIRAMEDAAIIRTAIEKRFADVSPDPLSDWPKIKRAFGVMGHSKIQSISGFSAEGNAATMKMAWEIPKTAPVAVQVYKNLVAEGLAGSADPIGFESVADGTKNAFGWISKIDAFAKIKSMETRLLHLIASIAPLRYSSLSGTVFRSAQQAELYSPKNQRISMGAPGDTYVVVPAYACERVLPPGLFMAIYDKFWGNIAVNLPDPPSLSTNSGFLDFELGADPLHAHGTGFPTNFLCGIATLLLPAEKSIPVPDCYGDFGTPVPSLSCDDADGLCPYTAECIAPVSAPCYPDTLKSGSVHVPDSPDWGTGSKFRLRYRTADVV